MVNKFMKKILRRNWIFSSNKWFLQTFSLWNLEMIKKEKENLKKNSCPDWDWTQVLGIRRRTLSHCTIRFHTICSDINLISRRNQVTGSYMCNSLPVSCFSRKKHCTSLYTFLLNRKKDNLCYRFLWEPMRCWLSQDGL